MMSWFSVRPAPAFGDKDGSLTAALASAVSRFGIVAAKADMSVSLHLGVGAHEGHHVRSLPDASIEPAGLPPAGLSPDGGDPEVVQFRLRGSLAVPLCAAPEPCLLYAHSSELPDFVVGLVGRRVPDSVVARRRAPLARRAASAAGRRRPGGGGGGGRTAADLDRLAAAKLAGGPFFLCRIFASCPGGLGQLLSSLRFAHECSGPNALVPGRPRRIGGGGGEGCKGDAGRGALRSRSLLAEPPARLTRIAGRATAPVLSPAEMASVLALPPAMFGLQMMPGAGRTFTNARTGAADPAAPFARTGEWGQ